MDTHQIAGLAEETKTVSPNTRCQQAYNMRRSEFWVMNMVGLVLMVLAVVLNKWLVFRGLLLAGGIGLMVYLHWWRHWRRVRYRFNRQFMATLDCLIDALDKGGSLVVAYQRLADHAPWPTDRSFQSVWRETAVSGYSDQALFRINRCLGSEPLGRLTDIIRQGYDDRRDLVEKLGAMRAKLPRNTAVEYWYERGSLDQPDA